MSKNINLQEQFLDNLQQEQRPVTLITVNGFQLKGVIVDHDQDTILMDVDGKRPLVYKHAVSTIVRREG